jgi:hypothetical protein
MLRTFQAYPRSIRSQRHSWTSWHRWTTLALLAREFLAVPMAIERDAATTSELGLLTFAEHVTGDHTLGGSEQPWLLIDLSLASPEIVERDPSQIPPLSLASALVKDLCSWHVRCQRGSLLW